MNRRRGVGGAGTLALPAIVAAALMATATVLMAAATVLVAAALTPASAHATDVTATALRALATRAADGSAPALVQLRSVTAVDGQPAQIGAALAGAGPAQVRSRALALARTGGSASSPAPAGADQARALAASILAGSRYGKATLPNPIDSALAAVGRWLASLAAQSPGGPVAFWAVAVAIMLALAALGARSALRRLDPARGPSTSSDSRAGEDPAALERSARAAERAGNYEEAVRLRFRAGLLSLGEHDAINYRPSLLGTDVARRLGSQRFDGLNDTFERVAYGGAEAEREDAEDAREGWSEVLAQTGGRR